MRVRLAGVCLVSLVALTSAFADNWPQWRGPFLNGTSAEKNLPLKWGPEENVTWKLAMPSWRCGPRRSVATNVVWTRSSNRKDPISTACKWATHGNGARAFAWIAASWSIESGMKPISVIAMKAAAINT